MNRSGEAMRARLGDLAKRRGVAVDLMLTRWLIERFLARLAVSRHRHRYALKGAVLFTVWEGDLLRSTSDVDLLGIDSADCGKTVDIVREIVDTQPANQDGLIFDLDQIRPRDLQVGRVTGQRIVIPVQLGVAALRLKVDIVYDLPVTPAFEFRLYPTLLEGDDHFRLLCYPRETVIAEKLASAIEFGADNSQVRDYYDLWYLSSRYHYEGHTLVSAMRATFGQREAGPILQRTTGYWEAAFDRHAYASPPRQRTWKNWITNHAPASRGLALGDVVDRIRSFALPPIQALKRGRQMKALWTPDGRWH